MYVSASESRVLARIFGLLSEDLSERDVRDTTLGELKALLSRSGETCTLKIERGGTMRTLTVALKNRL